MLLLGLVLAGLPRPAGAAASTQPITVFAAASLTNAMQGVAKLWTAQGHVAPTLSFGSSGTLAQGIAQGAPGDVFVSADNKWMDWLQTRTLIRAGTRALLLGNTLVLVEKQGAASVALVPGFDFGSVLGAQGRLAVGDPASVPAGIYAKQALTKLGAWSSVQGRLAPAENVRAALLLVERGEAPAGIVYGSDVMAAPGLAVAGMFPADSHDPIVYPAALLAHCADPAFAESFLAFLRSPAAASVFRHAGFTVLGQ